MTDAAAILQAILDDPADDLPRLAYADLCEESGDDLRAELIRLQIATERWITTGKGGIVAILNNADRQREILSRA